MSTPEDNDPDHQVRLDGATVDVGRQYRCGFAEVIYGEGKPVELIEQIISTQQSAGQASLVTRIGESAAKKIIMSFPHGVHCPIGRTLRVGVDDVVKSESLPQDLDSPPRHVAVVTAGSTDAPVSAEATETLTWMKTPFRTFTDIGVAGPQRLLAAVPRLRQASAVIVIAGMEGALPAAIGGHLSVPIFAVPTSVGYGASFGGITALLGMLSSCASNIAVVNIDAGFKAAYLAGLIVRQLNEASQS